MSKYKDSEPRSLPLPVKKNSESVAVYDKATEPDSLTASDHFKQGNALFASKEYHGAIVAYDNAIELNPNSAVAYFNKGNAWNASKEYRGAIEEYDKAIERNPNYATAHFKRGNALKALKNERAIVEYSSLNERDGSEVVGSEKYNTIKDDVNPLI